MKENNENKVINEVNEMPKKKTMKTATKVIIAIIILAVILIASNVYASVNGYGNVFFMIRNVFSGEEEVKGKDTLFSDRDITISYSSIEITDGLKVQVQRITLEKDLTTLYLYVQNETQTVKMPLKYKVYDENNNLLKEYTSTKEEEMFFYENIKIEKTISENAKIRLEIYDNSDNLLSNMTIDLQNKEVLIGNNKVEQISEIELKKYLGAFAELNIDEFIGNDYSMVDGMLYVAGSINEIINGDLSQPNREKYNKLIESFYYEDIKFDNNVAKTGKLYFYDKDKDSYLTEGFSANNGICLDIEDISYKDGIYSVKFIYCFSGSEDPDSFEKLSKYEATIQLKINENAEYSKYKIVSLTEGVLLKDTSKEETDTSKTDNLNNEEISPFDYGDTSDQFLRENNLKSLQEAYYDIDKDGINELILLYDINGTSKQCIYTYKNNKVIKIGPADFDYDNAEYTELYIRNNKLIKETKYKNQSKYYCIISIVPSDDKTIFRLGVTSTTDSVYQSGGKKLEFNELVNYNYIEPVDEKIKNNTYTEIREYINAEREETKSNNRFVATSVEKTSYGRTTYKSSAEGVNVFNVILDEIEDNIIDIERMSTTDYINYKTTTFNQISGASKTIQFKFEDNPNNTMIRDMFVEWTSNKENSITISWWTGNSDDTRSNIKFTLDKSAEQILEKVNEEFSLNKFDRK